MALLDRGHIEQGMAILQLGTHTLAGLQLRRLGERTTSAIVQPGEASGQHALRGQRLQLGGQSRQALVLGGQSLMHACWQTFLPAQQALGLEQQSPLRSALETFLQQLYAATLARQGLRGPRQAQGRAVQALALLIQAAHQALTKTLAQVLQAGEQFLARRCHQLSGGCRGGGAQIGSEVAECHVGFMAHAAYHGQPAAGHGTHQEWVIEGPEVFQRTATTHEQDDLHPVQSLRLCQRRAQLRRRLGALHEAGHHDGLQLRRAPRQSRHDIVQRGSPERGDDGNALGKRGQRPLAGGIEHALGLQLGLEAQELLIERALARRLHELGDELQVSPRLVKGDAATAAHPLAVLRRETQLCGAAPEQSRTDQRRGAVGVLQAEIVVAAGGAGEARQLALHRDVGEARAQLLGQLLQQRGDAQRAAGTGGDKQGGRGSDRLAIIAADFRGDGILFAIVQAAGWPIWPLLACSVLALALIIERFWSLRANKVVPPALLADIEQLEGKALPGADTADKLAEHSLLGEVLASGLRSVLADPLINDVRLRQVFEVAGRGAVHQLERYLTLLGTIATAAPLLGLLGTVVGMIEIFASQTPGSGSPEQLAHGISIALYNTAFGLIVAIPALICHRHFRRLVDGFELQLENATERFYSLLTRHTHTAMRAARMHAANAAAHSGFSPSQQ